MDELTFDEMGAFLGVVKSRYPDPLRCSISYTTVHND